MQVTFRSFCSPHSLSMPRCFSYPTIPLLKSHRLPIIRTLTLGFACLPRLFKLGVLAPPQTLQLKCMTPDKRMIRIQDQTHPLQ